MITEAGESEDAIDGDGRPEEPAEPSGGGSADAAWEPAPIAGRYRVGEYLGTSRLGRTYRARDSETDQEVEVTFLDAEAVTAPDAADRLEQLRNLRHLHVLPLQDWQLDPVPYLVYPATTMRLQHTVESGASLTPSQTLLIGLQAAESLHSLRRSGITHGAINPARCCVDARGRLRLAEMGVDFLRRPLQASEATRYDAPESIRATDRESPATVTGAGAAGVQEVQEESEAPETSGSDAADLAAPDAAGDDAPVLDGDQPTEPPEPVVAAEAGTGEMPVVAAEGDTAVAPGLLEPPPSGGDPVAAAAAADVYSLAVVLAEAAAGRPVAPAEISQLGRSIVPVSAGATTTRHLSRLAPLLAQASAARPENRLEADELALALRASAELFPPPTRLDEAFRRVDEHEVDPEASEPGAASAAAPPRRRRKLVMRLAAAAAVIAAGALLVIVSAPGDRTPTHEVPSVVGMDWPRAAEILTEEGWEVRRLEVRVRGVAPGEVVGQLPGPGGLLDEGQVVKVQVTLGEPLVVVPADIVGMTVADAELRLSAIGLSVGSVQTLVDPEAPEGSVVAVEALPELPRGATVDLVVAGGG